MTNQFGGDQLPATTTHKGMTVPEMNALAMANRLGATSTHQVATTTPKGTAIARMGVLASTNNQVFHSLATTT